jgi:hypothetical protein
MCCIGEFIRGKYRGNELKILLAFFFKSFIQKDVNYRECFIKKKTLFNVFDDDLI